MTVSDSLLRRVPRVAGARLTVEACPRRGGHRSELLLLDHGWRLPLEPAHRRRLGLAFCPAK